MIFILLSSFFSIRNSLGVGGGGYGSITESTVKREPLASGLVNETNYYTDELGWISSGSNLTAGMKKFYERTGVQPYLYLIDNVDGNYYPSGEELDAFAQETYYKLFTDEAHLLVVYQEYDGYYYLSLYAGGQARLVIDTEAEEIIFDYIDYYYYDDLTDEQFFSKVFDSASQRMMHVEISPLVIVGVLIAVAAIFCIAFIWWRKRKEQKNLEAEQTRDILNTPLETFGETQANSTDSTQQPFKSYNDAQVENLAKKYAETPNNEPPKGPSQPNETTETPNNTPPGETSEPKEQ